MIQTFIYYLLYYLSGKNYILVKFTVDLAFLFTQWYLVRFLLIHNFFFWMEEGGRGNAKTTNTNFTIKCLQIDVVTNVIGGTSTE